jgi:hypothetical protein
MSRLWDRPEFWVRTETDELLREMWDTDLLSLASSFERSAASYDGGPEMAAAIVSELRRRAAAGVRFWPGPRAVDGMEGTELVWPGDVLPMSEPDAVLLDDEIPW